MLLSGSCRRGMFLPGRLLSRKSASFSSSSSSSSSSFTTTTTATRALLSGTTYNNSSPPRLLLSSSSSSSFLFSQPQQKREYHTRNRNNNALLMSLNRLRNTEERERVNRTWHLFDARHVPVGRMAGQIARLLMGKENPKYWKNQDGGGTVVVVNCDHVFMRGNKMRMKVYKKHSGYPGGLNVIPAWRMKERKPEMIVKLAVHSMLPKNRLRKVRMSRLLCFRGPEHDYPDIFQEHQSVDWPSDEGRFDPSDHENLVKQDLMEGWIYDLEQMVRYREIDGVYHEVPLESYKPGMEPPPHKYPTSGY